MRRLNLGSGSFKKEEFINLDWDEKTNPDILHDLNKFPYPFKDEEFNLVEADHILEHLDDPFKVMKEIYRILKPGGELIIRVPHFSRGFLHPEHKRGFDVSFPLYFNSDFKGGYAGFPFELKEMKLSWLAQRYLKKMVLSRSQYSIGALLGSVFDFLAKLSPYCCSRIWCFWVGGFEGIEFKFNKPK